MSKSLLVIIVAAVVSVSARSDDLPNFEEVAVIRAKADQERFKRYVLKKLEVHSYVQKKRGMCLDFVGDSDGLYRSIFDSGPIMVDLANCGEEDDWVDGRIRALQVLDAREQRGGLSKDQVDQVIDQINVIFADKIYDPEIKG